MKRNKSLLFLALSLIGFGGGYFILKIYNCGYSIFCYDLFSKVGDPLFYGIGALAIIFFVLLFIPKAIPQWKKFAKWFIPIATLIFIFYPNPGSGDLFSPFPEQIFQWVSILYVFVSLMIIGYSTRKS